MKSDSVWANSSPHGVAKGFLLGDKKAGRFKLEVDWIKVTTAEEPSQEPS